MDDLILETKNLSKTYDQQMAVHNICMRVRKNTVYGLLGPNGAGKSTLMKMLVGIIRPTEGQILFEGENLSRRCLSQIGSLIEAPALYGNLTARENLMPEERIDEVLDIVDLKDTGKKRAAKFSMGMKQRLGIAIALLNHPSLVILDEPTNGLDPFGVKELRELIASFPSRGITVVLSSHILSEVEQVVDEVGIISNGNLLYQGIPDKREDLEEFFTDVIMKGGRK